ncbi:facilitated trehalose transporter Tret1-2 homolog [Leptidea sinapis]|uniref:facilitated trehalose transporter Tret1-2 homolog n=1 Tax=Leptidea sinapis TaxID=189913 RepID=UPI0021406315|nr:facilitated trehalose transporter Tret1-2 homolog [Leptidea sinapis]
MGKIRQFQTTLACAFSYLISAMFNVWPSYTISEYTAQNTTVISAPMTSFEVSMVGSLPSFGAMFGTMCAGTIFDVFGRQKGGLFIAFTVLLSWILVEITTSSLVIIVARFLAGLASGGASVHGPIFISEVAEESIRGMLGSAPMAFYCVGVLISYLCGWLLSYHQTIWVNMALCIMYVGLLLSSVESPVFLIKKNREEEARMSIALYRGESPDSKVVLEELSRLKQRLQPAELVPMSEVDAEKAEKEKLEGSNENETCENKMPMPPYKMLFISPSSRRAFIVVGIAMSTQVMMGLTPAQVYAKDIFSQAAPGLSSHMCSVMFALVLVCGSMCSVLLSDKFGRRPLLLASAIGVCVCLVSMGFLMQTNVAPPWLTACVILAFCFVFMFGAGSVPYLLLTEVFMSEVQSLASIIIMEWMWLLSFFILGVFPLMAQYLGIPGSFYIFAGFSVIDILLAIFMLPETKGLTKEQIQEAFLGRKQK